MSEKARCAILNGAQDKKGPLMSFDSEELPRTGDWVGYLQELLQRAGYWNEERAEEYDPRLERAVMSFQRDHDLEADGVPRGATWAALVEATDTDPNKFEIDWENDYPEIYRLATATDFDAYLRRFVDVDPAVFKDGSE